MKTTALGLIEVKGFLGAVEAADASLKAANVTLLNVEVIRGGFSTVKIVGDVAAVRAAVDAGKDAAEKCSTVLSTHVIARTHEETLKMVDSSKKKVWNTFEKQPNVKEQVPGMEMNELDDHETKQDQQEEINNVNIEDQKIEEKETEEKETEEKAIEDTRNQEELSETDVQNPPNHQLTFDNLEKMTVEELRRLARSLHIKGVKPKDIKFGRKDYLIKIIMNHLGRRKK